MINWRRQLGMVPRELRDRVPKELQWRFNEHLARLAQDAKRAWRHPTLGWTIPSRVGKWQMNAAACVAILIVWIAFGAMSIYGMYMLAPRFGLPPALAPIAVFVLFWTVTLAIRGSTTPDTSETERLAWRALNIIGLRTCEQCGYDCRTIDTIRCPECGHAVPEVEAANNSATNAIQRPSPQRLKT